MNYLKLLSRLDQLAQQLPMVQAIGLANDLSEKPVFDAHCILITKDNPSQEQMRFLTQAIPELNIQSRKELHGTTTVEANCGELRLQFVLIHSLVLEEPNPILSDLVKDGVTIIHDLKDFFHC